MPTECNVADPDPRPSELSMAAEAVRRWRTTPSPRSPRCTAYPPAASTNQGQIANQHRHSPRRAYRLVASCHRPHPSSEPAGEEQGWPLPLRRGHRPVPGAGDHTGRSPHVRVGRGGRGVVVDLVRSLPTRTSQPPASGGWYVEDGHSTRVQVGHCLTSGSMGAWPFRVRCR
jgi:hypothetical protein